MAPIFGHFIFRGILVMTTIKCIPSGGVKLVVVARNGNACQSGENNRSSEF